MTQTAADLVLDNAIWFSLTTRHSNIAEGKGRARRYPIGVSPLGAILDASDASFEALASLLGPDEEIALGSPTEISPGGGLEAFARMELRQMVRSSLSRPIAAPHVIPLGAADVADMLALVEITKPGPFRKRTHELGQYFGIRVDGRLAAMAGERLRPAGYTEISAVCTHPDYRGRSYGRDLVETLVRNIVDRGDVPILHVEKDNRAASLYENIGFSMRQTIHLVGLRKPSSMSA
jgi:ribosomal protein S18 acetylase RimI-like enzyme